MHCGQSRPASTMAALMRNVGLSVLLSWATLTAPAQAQNNQKELETAFIEADKVKVEGPAEIAVLDQGTLKLPANYIFVPKAAAEKIMRAFGNHTGDGFVGVIFGAQKEANWMAIINYEKSGYIKDDDARNWDVEALFDSLKAGTEETNKERASRGIAELELLGWVEKPTYNAGPHQLIWSMAGKDKGAPANAPQSVNYNTYVLGREGYISLNFITGRDEIEAQKPIARELLTALTFTPGKTYADFNPDTDKMAEYGLAALIGGVAAKKLGFFALIAAFAAKWIKLIILAVAGIGVAIRKVLTGKKGEA